MINEMTDNRFEIQEKYIFDIDYLCNFLDIHKNEYSGYSHDGIERYDFNDFIIIIQQKLRRGIIYKLLYNSSNESVLFDKVSFERFLKLKAFW